MTGLPIRIIGIYSPLQAKLLKHLGATSAWISGYGISADQFGYPDLDVMSYTEKMDRQLGIIRSADLDYVVDIDNGIDNPFAFERYLDCLEGAGAVGVCIEDEMHPKVSALYKSTKPLMSLSDFSTTLNRVNRHRNLRVYARTNAFVRGHSLAAVEERVGRILDDTNVTDIVLHGNRPSDFRRLLMLFKDRASFYLITSLSPDCSLETYRDIGFSGLIMGHNLVFATVEFQKRYLTELFEAVIVQPPSPDGRRLIDALIPWEPRE